MKKIALISVVFVFFILGLLTGCKEASKTEAEKDKTKTTDTVKKNTSNVDDLIVKIQKYRAENEAKLLNKTFTKKEISLNGEKIKENIKQKWEKLDVYLEGDKVIRIQTYPHKGISERTEEFYLQNEALVFAFIQDKGPKNEGKDTGQPGKEFYFDKDKLIKYVNTSGEEVKNSDEEKNMYETRLPYEIKELLEIIKSSK